MVEVLGLAGGAEAGGEAGGDDARPRSAERTRSRLRGGREVRGVGLGGVDDVDGRRGFGHGVGSLRGGTTTECACDDGRGGAMSAAVLEAQG